MDSERQQQQDDEKRTYIPDEPSARADMVTMPDKRKLGIILDLQDHIQL